MTSPQQDSFTSDLNQLTEVATLVLPELVALLEQQAKALNQYDGLSVSTMSSNADSVFYELNGAIRDHARHAVTTVSATAEALHDIVALYRRADGQG